MLSNIRRGRSRDIGGKRGVRSGVARIDDAADGPLGPCSATGALVRAVRRPVSMGHRVLCEERLTEDARCDSPLMLRSLVIPAERMWKCPLFRAQTEIQALVVRAYEGAFHDRL